MICAGTVGTISRCADSKCRSIDAERLSLTEVVHKSAKGGRNKAMFKKTDITLFEKKVWLATPTMHSEELKYVTEAYETNWGMKDNRDNR